MLNLPKDTLFDKRIPKKKFYENLDVTPTLKRLFIDEIKVIYWRNKLSPETINIQKGNKVNEIQIFLIRLNQKSIDERILTQIDRCIPYHIVFVLEYEDLYKTVVSYKEDAMAGNNSYKVDGYYSTDWVEENEVKLELVGLDLDAVYENLLRNVGGDRLKINKDESIKDSIERDNKIQCLNKQIQLLESKRKKTIQLNKKMAINDEIRALKIKRSGLMS